MSIFVKQNILFQMNKANKYIASLITVMCFTACEEKDITNVMPHKDKTVITYIAADNNLDFTVRTCIDNMKEGFGKNLDNANFLVLVDTRSTTPQLIHLTKGKDGEIHENVVATFPESNVVDATFMSEVLNEVKSRFPASNYSLDYWSHGLSWVPDNNPFYAPSTKWIGQDGNETMDIKELREAIENSGIKFDYILFDACLMSSIEVAYELRNTADMIIASPIEIWEYAFPYKDISDLMCDKTNRAVEIAEKYAAFYNGSDMYSTGAIAVLKCSELEKLADEVRNIFKDSPVSVDQIDTDDIQYYDRYTYDMLYDLQQYIDAAAKVNGKDLTAFHEQMNNTVVYKYTTSTFATINIDTERYSGIGTYIPVKEYTGWNRYYQTLDWFKATEYLPFF